MLTIISTRRSTLEEYKKKNRESIPKDKFPRLLKKTIKNMGTEAISKDIKSGFRASGIVPIDRDQVLKRLPQKKKHNLMTKKPLLNNSGVEWALTFENFLEESHRKETEPLKKLNVPPGRGIESISDNTCDRTEVLVKDALELQPKVKRQRRNDDTETYSVHDLDSDRTSNDSSEDDAFDNTENQEVNSVPNCKVKMNDFSIGMFVIVDLIFSEYSKKEIIKQYYGQIIEKDDKIEKVRVKFLRKSLKSFGNVYVFPVVDDELEVHLNRIVSTAKPISINRGKYTFPLEINC